MFLAPSLVVLAVVAGWPLLRTFWFSLTDANLSGMERARFVGLANFKELMSDERWWQSVWTTFRFALISVALETVLGLMIALVLNARFRGRGLLRAAVLVPWAIPTVVSARMWGWMFNDVYGVVNEILLALGVVEEGLAWTADPDLALAAVVAVDVWKTAPFMTLLILAALQTLPEDVYEAAQIDGAGRIRQFFSITIPQLKYTIITSTTLIVVGSLVFFDLIFVLTAGGPGDATRVLALDMYKRGFMSNQMGPASVIATILVVLGLLLALLLRRLGGSTTASQQEGA